MAQLATHSYGTINLLPINVQLQTAKITTYQICISWMVLHHVFDVIHVDKNDSDVYLNSTCIQTYQIVFVYKVYRTVKF